MAQTFFKKLNAFYLGRSELWEIDFSWEGFSWISNDDDSQSVIGVPAALTVRATS